MSCSSAATATAARRSMCEADARSPPKSAISMHPHASAVGSSSSSASAIASTALSFRAGGAIGFSPRTGGINGPSSFSSSTSGSCADGSTATGSSAVGFSAIASSSAVSSAIGASNGRRSLHCGPSDMMRPITGGCEDTDDVEELVQSVKRGPHAVSRHQDARQAPRRDPRLAVQSGNLGHSASWPDIHQDETCRPRPAAKPAVRGRYVFSGADAQVMPGQCAQPDRDCGTELTSEFSPRTHGTDRRQAESSLKRPPPPPLPAFP